jgi:tetratricopeptide (TPR) repeat protein
MPSLTPNAPESGQETEAAFARGLRLHQSGDLEAAATVYNTILARDPQHADSLHLLGAALAQTGELTQGIEALQAALEISPNEPTFRLNYAETRPLHIRQFLQLEVHSSLQLQTLHLLERGRLKVWHGLLERLEKPPALHRRVRPRHVAQDREEPGLERPRGVEVVEHLHRPAKRLLHDVLRVFQRLCELPGHGQDRPHVAFDQMPKRALISCSSPPDQVLIREF